MSNASDKEAKSRSKRAKKSQPETKLKETDSEGLPDPGSIVDEVPFTSPKGNRYRIIISDETDAYEKPQRPRKQKDD